jgi:hypothetical protein
MSFLKGLHPQSNSFGSHEDSVRVIHGRGDCPGLAGRQFQAGRSVPVASTGARAEKVRRKIQLMKKSEILIPHLPQPGPAQATAYIIISVSKP